MLCHCCLQPLRHHSRLFRRNRATEPAWPSLHQPAGSCWRLRSASCRARHPCCYPARYAAVLLLISPPPETLPPGFQNSPGCCTVPWLLPCIQPSRHHRCTYTAATACTTTATKHLSCGLAALEPSNVVCAHLHDSLARAGKGICSLTAHSGRMSTLLVYWICCRSQNKGAAVEHVSTAASRLWTTRHHAHSTRQLHEA